VRPSAVTSVWLSEHILALTETFLVAQNFLEISVVAVFCQVFTNPFHRRLKKNIYFFPDSFLPREKGRGPRSLTELESILLRLKDVDNEGEKLRFLR
jgi:hypothetical protein